MLGVWKVGETSWAFWTMAFGEGGDVIDNLTVLPWLRTDQSWTDPCVTGARGQFFPTALSTN